MHVGKLNTALLTLTVGQNTGPNLGGAGAQKDAQKAVAAASFLPENSTRAIQHVNVSGKKDSASDAPPKTAFEKIVEQGFSHFFAELEAKKMKELREKILGAMGLNEETLSKLPAKQREAIEKAVAAEIKRRLGGGDVMNGESGAPKMTHSSEIEKLIKGVSKSAGLGLLVNGDVGAKKGHMGMGIGPLLALQEIDQKGPHLILPDGSPAPGKKDLEDA